MSLLMTDLAIIPTRPMPYLTFPVKGAFLLKIYRSQNTDGRSAFLKTGSCREVRFIHGYRDMMQFTDPLGLWL